MSGDGFFAGVHALEDKSIDRHWANAARYRSIGADTVHKWGKFNVTNAARVVAGVYNHGTVFYPLSFDKFGFADCAY